MSRGPGKLIVAIRDAVLAGGGKDVTSRELAAAIHGEGFTAGQLRSVQRALRTLPPEWGIKAFPSGHGLGSGTPPGVELRAFASTATEADKVRVTLKVSTDRRSYHNT